MHIFDNYSHEYKTRRILDLEKILLQGNDIWADSTQYHQRTQSFLTRARVKESKQTFWTEPFIGRPAWNPKRYLNLLSHWIISSQEQGKTQVQRGREMMQASMTTVFKTLGAVHALPRQWWRTKVLIPWICP